LTKVDVEKAKVAPSTTYVAQVTLKPADGFAFTAGEATVTFGGDEMTVLASTADREGNNWAQLQEDGSILVSHDFTSSADVLQEIVAPGSVNAEYGTAVSAVEDLPREVQIITENGKANVDVTWVDGEGKVAIVAEEGTEDSTDDEALNKKREAHTVKVQGAVAIPDGVTIPDGMEAKTTLTIKVAADQRLVPEANAAELAEQAQGVIDRTPADAEPVTQDLKDKLEKALKDMNDYIDTWNHAENPSTVDGIQEEMEKVRAAMYDLMNALEPIPVLPVKKLGEIAIGEKLPKQALSTDPRVHDDSKPADISWTNTPKDTRVEEGKTYEAHIIFKPAYDGAFREGGLVMFDDNVQVEIHGAENTDGNRAWIDSEGNLNLIRNITVDKINLVSIDDCAPLNAEFGDSVDSVGLPKTVTANTDAGERKLAVNWDTDRINLGNTDKREAHDVVVSGTAVKPDAIENPDEVSLDVEITIHVAADPRLAPESKAEKLASDAQDAIEAAEEAGIAEEEVQALKDALENMDEYVKDLDNSTVKGINDEIAKVQSALDALNSFIEHNTVIEMTLFGTDEKNDYKLDYGDKISTSYNLVTATDKDNSVKTTAAKTKWKTDDENVKSATDYLVEVTLQAAEGAQFNVNRKINFDGVEILMKNEAPEAGATEYATISADKKSVVVARTYTSNNAKFKSADAVADKSVSFGTEPTAAKLGLPGKDSIKTDDSNKNYVAEVEWDLSAYEKDYNNRNNANANRAAHEVTVTGTLKAVEGVDGVEGKKITAKIKVAADPRLEKEATAVKVANNAATAIAEAKKLGVGANEIAALEAAVKAMNDEVSKNNLAKSTAASDQKKIDAVDPNLKALQKVISDKKAADKKAAEEKKANTVNNKVGIRAGANQKAVEKYITGRASDSDPKGAAFGKLKMRSPKQTTKSVAVSFKKVKNAKKYVIYGNACGKKNKMKKLKTLKKVPKRINLKKIAGKKVKKGTYYKLMIVAYDSKSKVVSVSPVIHVAAKGKLNKSNPTGLTVKAKINKAGKKLKKYTATKAITLKKGKTTVLKSAIKKAKRTKVQKHMAVRYETSNKKIATVNKKGKVKGINKGKATVWAYTQNGLYKAIRVTVK
ncbi:MAG: Ig-like domain-containing protein, partial [Firmicutes bacterium]|nr:Ig-like domain-containing protein [Bacillota bacterium]